MADPVSHSVAYSRLLALSAVQTQQETCVAGPRIQTTTWAMPNVVAHLPVSARPVEAAGDSLQGFVDPQVASHRMVKHIQENHVLGVRRIRHHNAI